MSGSPRSPEKNLQALDIDLQVISYYGFNENNDIIVSSWGDNYVIPKDFFNHLEYKSIKIYEKEKSKRSI